MHARTVARSRLAAGAATALFALVAPFAGSAAAQQGGGESAAPGAASFGERIEVELVGVEVWVTGPDGEPVPGLTAADFGVRHDGRPVEITHFSEVRDGEIVPASAKPAVPAEPAGDDGATEAGEDAPASAPIPAEPGHLVLYFDQLRLDPGGYRAVLEGVRQVMADAAVPAERILVLRQDTGLHLEAPFGSSEAEIDAALERVASGSGAGMAAAAELQQAKEAILAAWEQAESLSGSAQTGLNAAGAAAGGGAGGGDTGFGTGPRAAIGGSGGSGGSILPSACDIFHQRAQPILDGWIRDRSSRISITLAHLNGTAGFLAGLPGVKTMLYVSDGLDIEPGAALAGFVTDFCPTRTREQETQALAESLGRDFRTLAARFNARRVTIHAVQGSGLRAAGVGAASERGTSAPMGSRVRFESRQRQSDRSGMTLLATETGGRTLFNRNELGSELAAVGRDMGSYYSIAYPPPAGDGESAGERREHRIEVTLADRSLTARYRHGFRPPEPDRWMADRLAGALHLGITSNPLEVRLGMGERPAEGEPLRLYAMVPVDRLVFVPAEGGAVAHLELRGIVQSPGAEPPVPVGQEFRLRMPPGAEDERVSLPLELEVGPGAHRVAVGLRDLGSGEASFVTTGFER